MKNEIKIKKDFVNENENEIIKDCILKMNIIEDKLFYENELNENELNELNNIKNYLIKVGILNKNNEYEFDNMNLEIEDFVCNL